MITVNLKITIDEDDSTYDKVIQALEIPGVTVEEIEDTYHEYNIDSTPHWLTDWNCLVCGQDFSDSFEGTVTCPIYGEVIKDLKRTNLLRGGVKE